ncbi:MAG: MarR family winged helix-turn-helix transcriptional regulator [Spirochaetota bacterium]
MNPLQSPEYHNAIGAVLTLHRYLRRSAKARNASGFSGKQHATLRALMSGRRTIGELARLLFVGESTTSELVARLEQAGYVKRIRSEADNRVVHVSITDAGTEAAVSIPLTGLPLLRERLGTLSPAELNSIAETFRGILALLDVDYET